MTFVVGHAGEIAWCPVASSRGCVRSVQTSVAVAVTSHGSSHDFLSLSHWWNQAAYRFLLFCFVFDAWQRYCRCESSVECHVAPHVASTPPFDDCRDLQPGQRRCMPAFFWYARLCWCSRAHFAVAASLCWSDAMIYSSWMVPSVNQSWFLNFMCACTLAHVLPVTRPMRIWMFMRVCVCVHVCTC